MSKSNTRFSFSKNNMNAAIAMGKNAYGQTVLDAERIDVPDDDTRDDEFKPYIGENGEMVHNQSVLNSPTLQRFLHNYAEMTAVKTSEPHVVVASSTSNERHQIESGDVQVSNLDEYAKELQDDLPEPLTEPLPEPRSEPAARLKKSFASKSMVKFCVECGCGFSELEKFCPHCGHKRSTYTIPTT